MQHFVERQSSPSAEQEGGTMAVGSGVGAGVGAGVVAGVLSSSTQLHGVCTPGASAGSTPGVQLDLQLAHHWFFS